MYSAADVTADYRDMLSEYGEEIIIRRYTGTDPQIMFGATVKARVKGYAAAPLVGGVMQGSIKIIALIEDLIAAQFPLPVRDDDKVFVRGKESDIVGVDNNTGRVGTTQVFAIITAKG